MYNVSKYDTLSTQIYTRYIIRAHECGVYFYCTPLHQFLYTHIPTLWFEQFPNIDLPKYVIL